MKVIEGFHIKKIQRGTKKGQDYINHNKRYVWKIPERLEGQIDKGDIVWVHAKKDNKDISHRNASLTKGGQATISATCALANAHSLPGLFAKKEEQWSR